MKSLVPLEGRVNALLDLIGCQGDVGESDAQGIEGGNAPVNGFEEVIKIARLILDSLNRVADVVKGDAPALGAFSDHIKNGGCGIIVIMNAS